MWNTHHVKDAPERPSTHYVPSDDVQNARGWMLVLVQSRDAPESSGVLRAHMLTNQFTHCLFVLHLADLVVWSDSSVLNMELPLTWVAAAAIAVLAVVVATVRWMGNRIHMAHRVVTAELLSRVLSEHEGHDIGVQRVEIEDIAQCGGGASTCDRLKLTLIYGQPPHAAAPTSTHRHPRSTHDEATSSDSASAVSQPERCVLKLLLLPWWMRLGATESAMTYTGALASFAERCSLGPLLFTIINAYSRAVPHAPDVMYRNEALFYRTVRPSLPESVEVPRCIGTVVNPESCMYGVLMEDLSLRGAKFPSALSGLPLASLRSLLVRTLAPIHAAHWRSSRFESGRDLAWTPTVSSGGMAPVFRTLGFGLIRDHLGRNEYERELLKPLGRTVEQLWEGLLRADAALSQDPVTLCHGDCHVGNTYLLPNGNAGLYDFQLTLRAAWARDVSYILATALSTSDRREHEQALLREYLHELESLGVSSPPSFENAWLLYRKSMAWGLVIGWLLCPEQNYGPEVLSANIVRLVSACQDLDTFGVLGV